MEDKMEKLKYPIGRYENPKSISKEDILEWIEILEKFPQRLESLVKDLSFVQLETPYRPEGWTIRQLIHHIGDSHHHSYTRFKWALAEDKPLIKVYEEKDWSKLIDAKTAPINLSLRYIDALHAKLVFLLKGLSTSDFKKCYMHPEGQVAVSVEENIWKYAWHSKHHYQHIANVIQRNGWL